MSRMNRRWFSGAILALLPSYTAAQTIKPKPAPNREPARSLKDIVASFAPSGTQGFVVMDAQTGKVLEGENIDRAMIPASVTKAATTLYALRSLGSRFHFQTRLIGTGKVENGVLRGDLILAGGGDPLLDTDGLGRLAEALVARGIKSVSGRFFVYSKALSYQYEIDKSQPDHVGYNPSLSGLNLNFNRVFFQWKRNGSRYDMTLTAKGRKYSAAVKDIRIVAANRDLPVYDYAKIGGRETWSVAESALGNSGSRWLPVREPSNYAGETFQAVAAQNGIKLPPAQSTKKLAKGVVLASERSAELSALTRGMLRFSTNLTAEIVGLWTSQTRGKGRSLSQSGAEMSSWLKRTYRVKSPRFVDHSGLGSASRITAADMAEILQGEGWDGPIRPLMKEIGLRNEAWKKAPMRGVEVVAKTGTLNFASALAGYMECANGRKLVFAIFTQNDKARAAIDKGERERPKGGKAWARQSRIFQHQLLRRWAKAYGSK